LAGENKAMPVWANTWSRRGGYWLFGKLGSQGKTRVAGKSRVRLAGKAGVTGKFGGLSKVLWRGLDCSKKRSSMKLLSGCPLYFLSCFKWRWSRKEPIQLAPIVGESFACGAIGVAGLRTHSNHVACKDC
jgi:hypothetical protein